MQRTLILLSALLCIAYAVLPPCSTSTCGTVGTVCAVATGSQCSNCVANVTSCLISAAGNPAASCTCYQNFGICSATAGTICSGSVFGFWSSCMGSLNNATCCGSPPTSLSSVSCHTPTTYCNTTTGLCTAVSTNGPCGSKIACGDPTTDALNPLLGTGPVGYVCTNGQCAFAPEYPAGAPCSSGSVCATGVCLNGACTGFASGTSCTFTNECNQGLYCDSTGSGNCAALIASGSACTTSDSCQFGSQCDGGTCVAYTTKTSGQSCISPAECSIGLTCFPAFTGTGTCIANPPVKMCTNDTQCAGDNRYAAHCVCLGGNVYQCPVVVPPDYSTACASQGIALDNCVKNKGCDSRLIGVTCCVNEFACLGNCAAGVFGGPNVLCGNPVTCTTPTTTSKSGAEAVQVSFLLAVVALLALVL